MSIRFFLLENYLIRKSQKNNKLYFTQVRSDSTCMKHKAHFRSVQCVTRSKCTFFEESEKDCWRLFQEEKEVDVEVYFSSSSSSSSCLVSTTGDVL